MIPTGTHKGVHRVGLALGIATTLGTLYIAKTLVIAQWAFAGGLKFGIVGQDDGQICIGHRHRATFLAEKHGDRGAPHTLAADQPVAQAEVDRALTLAALLQPFHCRLDTLAFALTGGDAIDRAGVDHRPRAGPGFGQFIGTGDLTARRLDHQLDRQTKFFGKLKVALVMARHGHNRAGAVAHHHIVGNPDRNLRPVDRVDRITAGENATLLLVSRAARHFIQTRSLCLIGFHRRALLSAGHLAHQPMFGGEDHKGCAPECVGPGGEDLDGVACRGVEGHFGPVAAPDPIGLHRLDPLRPLDLFHVVEQLLRVVRNAEFPLVQLFFDDLRVTAFAAPILAPDLFAGQRRVATGTPIHRCKFTVGQPGVIELAEEPL